MDFKRTGALPAPARRTPLTRLVALALAAGTVTAAGAAGAYSAAATSLGTAHGRAVPAPTENAPKPTAGLCAPTPLELEWAVANAATVGDTVAVAVLDRTTGRYTASANDTEQFPSASLSKLFIADDYLHQAALGGTPVDAETREGLTEMLSASNDIIASDFWVRVGGPASVARVVERYGLTHTTVPGWDWWNTPISAKDIATYYDRLLDGTGGLGKKETALIVDALLSADAYGTDGLDQRYGVWHIGERVGGMATKQGWMTLGSSTVRNSAGFAGEDGRYVVVALANLADGTPDTASDIANAAAGERLSYVVNQALNPSFTDDMGTCAHPAADTAATPASNPSPDGTPAVLTLFGSR